MADGAWVDVGHSAGAPYAAADVADRTVRIDPPVAAAGPHSANARCATHLVAGGRPAEVPHRAEQLHEVWRCEVWRCEEQRRVAPQVEAHRCAGACYREVRRSRRTGALVRATGRSDPVHGVAFVVGLVVGLVVGFAVGPAVGDGFVDGLAVGLVLGLPLGLVLGLPDADGLPFADGDASGDVDTFANVDAFGEPEGDGDTDVDGDGDSDVLGLTEADAWAVGDGLGAGGGGGRKAFVAAPSTAPSDVRLKTGFGAATMPSATARAANACGAPWSATDRLSACT